MSETLYQISNLSFTYPEEQPVLSELNFTVNPGERLAVKGATGSGKTTLLHLMTGLLKPDSGEIEAFGKKRVTEHDFHEVRTKAGLVFQSPDDQLFCATVGEDVAFGPLNLGKSRKEAMEIVENTLLRIGLQGYGNRITYHLSGGEKKLVALAGVLAMEPEILLLDEPSTGLDTKYRTMLIELLRKLECAMIVVSHDPEFLSETTGKSYQLDSGKLIPISN